MMQDACKTPLAKARHTFCRTIFLAHMLRSSREPYNKSISHTTDWADWEILIKLIGLKLKRECDDVTGWGQKKERN